MTDKNKGIGAMPGDGILEDSIVFNLLDIPFKEFTPGQVIQSKQFNDDMNDIEEKVNEMIQKGETVRQHYANHAGSKGNPHEVTAHQVGAYNVEDVDTFISDLKDGDLNDKSITNRVLTDECIDNRVLKNKSITATKVEEAFGSQIDISENLDIMSRYTKDETDELIKTKVGNGTYSKEELDVKFSEIQAGTIVDKTIGVEKFKDTVGEYLDIANNPQIVNRYTKNEVNTIISKYGLPKDWGSVTELPGDDSLLPPSFSEEEIFNKGVLDYSKVGNCIMSSDPTSLENFESFEEGDVITSERLNYILDKVKESNTLISEVDDKNVDVDVFNDFSSGVDEDISNVVNLVLDVNKTNDLQDVKIANIEKSNITRDNIINDIKRKNTEQDNTIESIKRKDVEQDNEISNIKRKDSEQDSEISNIKRKDVEQDDKLKTLEKTSTLQSNEIESIKKKDVSQDEILTQHKSQMEQIATKDREQDTRLKDIEYVNKRQDVVLGGLFNENADGRLSISGEGNDVRLENSKEGVIEVKSVVGDTMVNLMPGEHFSINPTSSGLWKYKYFSLNQPTKSNTLYTLVFNVLTNTGNISRFNFGGKSKSFPVATVDINRLGYYIVTTTSTDDTCDHSQLFIQYNDMYDAGEFDVEIMILEGDYTNKPIPQEAITGMQSTFEDKLITQEMIDAGEELAENLGKYKASVRVVGKNKCQNLSEMFARGEYIYNAPYFYFPIMVDSKKDYKIKVTANNIRPKSYLNVAVEPKYYYPTLTPIIVGSATLPNPYSIERQVDKKTLISNNLYVSYTIDGVSKSEIENYIKSNDMQIQLEEGTVATEYEPYREHKTSILLPEPLYKGNELCVHNGQLGYWKNYEKYALDENSSMGDVSSSFPSDTSKMFYIVKKDALNVSNSLICDTLKANIDVSNANNRNTEGVFVSVNGKSCAFYFRIFNEKLPTQDIAGFRTWVQTNPTNIIYKLAEPVFVPLLENMPQWILDSYNDCTVQFETNVPVSSSAFTYTGNIPSLPAMEKNLNNVNDEQDMQNEIDNTTMLAVADIFEILTPAIATSNINTKEGGNKMVELYVVLIMRGLKTIDQVPSSIRPQVEEMLKQVQ